MPSLVLLLGGPKYADECQCEMSAVQKRADVCRDRNVPEVEKFSRLLKTGKQLGTAESCTRIGPMGPQVHNNRGQDAEYGGVKQY